MRKQNTLNCVNSNTMLNSSKWCVTVLNRCDPHVQQEVSVKGLSGK